MSEQGLVRFNPYHAKAGSPAGGQFSSSSGGSGSGKAPAKAPGGHAALPPGGSHDAAKTPKQRLLAQAHADRERARTLETELRGLEHQERAAVTAAKHHAAQAAAAKKAGHVVHHHHHTAAHHRHHKHAATLKQRISHLKTEIHGLREHAAELEKRAHASRDGGLRLPELLVRTALTAEASTVHKPFGKPGGPGLWHTGKQLPAYIQSVAHHLAGHGESRAIEMAVGIVKNWAAGHDGHGHAVHPDVQAAAAKAIAEWEKLRAQAHSAKASRSMADSQYDPDGLDESWDGDHSDLPDLTGLQVHHFDAADGTTEPAASRAAPELGTGKRFKKLKSSLAAKGAHDPGALAAYIGRKKFGKAKFMKLASKARGGAKRSEDGHAAGDAVYFRTYELEDIHIVRSGQGDATGRLVEAYAAVFNSPAEISDFEGHYTEEIDPSAFNKVLSDVGRSRSGFGTVKCMFNHGLTMHGTPSERGSMPIGVPVDIRPETRGLLTLTRYSETPFADEILENIRNGAITAQSFTGRIVRSDPQLRRGEKHRPSGGRLPLVRRTELGLKEYGPTPFPAYSGAEMVGVRMSAPGTWAADDEDPAEALALDEEAAPGEPQAPEGDVHPTRDHAHRLLTMRTEQMCREAGIGPLRSQW